MVKIMKLCFGSIARILNSYRISSKNTSQPKLIKALLSLSVKTGEYISDITDPQATRLLKCQDAIPPAVVEDVRKVIETDEGRQKTKERFEKRIVDASLIKLDKESLIDIMSALRFIIESDKSILGDTKIDIISEKTKNVLLSQNEFVLSEIPSLLAGILIFTIIGVENKDKNKDYNVESINKDFIKSITNKVSIVDVVPLSVGNKRNLNKSEKSDSVESNAKEVAVSLDDVRDNISVMDSYHDKIKYCERLIQQGDNAKAITTLNSIITSIDRNDETEEENLSYCYNLKCEAYKSLRGNNNLLFAVLCNRAMHSVMQ